MTYAYRTLVASIDAYAQTHESAMFRQAWKRMKAYVTATAIIEFGGTGCTEEEALSYAWEEAEMAFRASTGPSLCGCVMEMWLYNEGKQAEFVRALKMAFKEADMDTPSNTLRRYSITDRKKKLVKSHSFHIDPVLPVHGPILADYCEDTGEDLIELQHELFLSAEEERDTNIIRRSVKNGHLKLISNISSEQKEVENGN